MPSELQRPNPGGVGQCRCGHSQPQHGYRKTEAIIQRLGKDLPGHGACGVRLCKCKKYSYVGWVGEVEKSTKKCSARRT